MSPRDAPCQETSTTSSNKDNNNNSNNNNHAMNNDAEEQQLRIDLAAAFRWAARWDFHEAVANHFSVAVSEDGQSFLLQKAGQHFSTVKASDLVVVNEKDDSSSSLSKVTQTDPSAWFLHSKLHRAMPQRARCVLHVHATYSLVLACLKDYEFLMTDQNACRFYNRIAYDRHFGGMALDDAEGERVASLMAQNNSSVLMMANHGVMVVGPTIAQALDELYYLEKAAKAQVLALQTGRELSIIPNDIAAKTERQWNEYPTDICNLHLNALKKILDKEEPDYKE